jgi:hypothetical protein
MNKKLSTEEVINLQKGLIARYSDRLTADDGLKTHVPLALSFNHTDTNYRILRNDILLLYLQSTDVYENTIAQLRKEQTAKKRSEELTNNNAINDFQTIKRIFKHSDSISYSGTIEACYQYAFECTRKVYFEKNSDKVKAWLPMPIIQHIDEDENKISQNTENETTEYEAPPNIIDIPAVADANSTSLWDWFFDNKLHLIRNAILSIIAICFGAASILLISIGNPDNEKISVLETNTLWFNLFVATIATLSIIHSIRAKKNIEKTNTEHLLLVFNIFWLMIWLGFVTLYVFKTGEHWACFSNLRKSLVINITRDMTTYGFLMGAYMLSKRKKTDLNDMILACFAPAIVLLLLIGAQYFNIDSPNNKNTWSILTLLMLGTAIGCFINYLPRIPLWLSPFFYLYVVCAPIFAVTVSNPDPQNPSALQGMLILKDPNINNLLFAFSHSYAVFGKIIIFLSVTYLIETGRLSKYFDKLQIS